MFEFAKLIHETLGYQSPKAFITVAALIGALIFGGVAWLIDRSYQLGMQESAISKRASAASSLSPPSSTPVAVIAEAPLDKETNMKNEENRRTKNRPLTQNAPGGINIGGDNLGSATVNNYGPPQPKPLVLNENQAIHVSESLKSFSGQSAAIYLVGDRSETQTFAVQLKNALAAAGVNVPVSTAGMLMRENGAGPPPPGVSVSVADNRLDIANALGIALGQQQVIEGPLGGTKSLKPDTFDIYITPPK